MTFDVPGHIRTLVPVWVATVFTWLAAEADIVIGADTAVQVQLAAVAVVTSIYYAAARQLEARFPGAGRLLGIAKQICRNEQ